MDAAYCVSSIKMSDVTTDCTYVDSPHIVQHAMKPNVVEAMWFPSTHICTYVLYVY